MCIESAYLRGIVVGMQPVYDILEGPVIFRRARGIPSRRGPPGIPTRRGPPGIPGRRAWWCRRHCAPTAHLELPFGWHTFWIVKGGRGL